MKLKLRTPWFLYKNEDPTENDANSVDPGSINPIERRKLKAACALNMCMVSLSQIVDYQNLEILKMEYDSILNNLNLEKVIKDEALLKALQAIMDACHFYILHAKDKEILKKKQQARLKGALNTALGGGNVIAVFGSGNPWAIAAGAAAMIGVAAVNYKSQREKAKLENEIDEWQLERSALEQLHSLRRTLFETAWRFAKKYNYPDSYRLTEKQIAVYNEIIKNPDPQSRYESLWLIRENFKAYPIFWYYLGRAALETSDAFREDSGNSDRKRMVAYGDGNALLSREYLLKAKDAYKTFKRCHIGNELMREDIVAASAYLDHAQLCDPSDPKELDEMIADVDSARALATMDVEIVQSCAFRYLQFFSVLKNGPERYRVANCAIDCLKFLLDRDANPDVNGRALSQLYKELSQLSPKDLDCKDEEHLLGESAYKNFSVVKSCVARRCPFVYQRLFPWNENEFVEDWTRFVKGAGLRRTAFNVFYGTTWLLYRDFLVALDMAKKMKSYDPIKALRDDEYEKKLDSPEALLPDYDEKENDQNALSKRIGLFLDVATIIQAPIYSAVKKYVEQRKEKAAWESDQSLTGIMKRLLDRSYERVAWKLFLGTRSAEFASAEFGRLEAELKSMLIRDAESQAETFALNFTERAKDVGFSLENIKTSGPEAAEPQMFDEICALELESEKLRLQIQELLGLKGGYRFPECAFADSIRREISNATRVDVQKTTAARGVAIAVAKQSRENINASQEALTDDVLNRAKANGVDSIQ